MGIAVNKRASRSFSMRGAVETEGWQLKVSPYPDFMRTLPCGNIQCHQNNDCVAEQAAAYVNVQVMNDMRKPGLYRSWMECVGPTINT